MVRATLGLAVALGLAACASAPPRVQTVTVKVPVEVAREPPKELVECTADLRAPRFVAPAGPGVSSCLTQEGERDLTSLVDRILTCEAAWRAWASTEAQ